MAGHEPGVLQQAAQVGVVIEAGRGADQEQVLVAVQQPEDQLPQGRLDVVSASWRSSSHSCWRS